MAVAELKIKASSQGASSFKAISSALRAVTKEIQKTAKELYKMGKTDAADSLGHLSMALGSVNEKLSSIAGKAKSASKGVEDSVKKMTAPFKDMDEQLKVIQQAWDFMNTGSSPTAVKAQISWVQRFDKAIGELGNTLTQAGYSRRKWEKSLDFTNIRKALQRGDLQLVGNHLKALNQAGLEAIGIDGNRAKALDKLSRKQKTIEKVLESSVDKSKKYRDAAIELNKQNASSVEAARAWGPALNKVSSAMDALRAKTSVSSKYIEKFSSKVDLVKATNAVLTGDLKATSKGFEVLTRKGLEALGMSEKMAEKNGLLAKSYTTTKSQLRALQPTIEKVAAATKESTLSLTKQASAMLKQGKSLIAVKGSLNQNITLQNQLANSHKELVSLEQKRAAATGKSLSVIQKESRANIDKAKSLKDVLLQTRKSVAEQKAALGIDTKEATARKRAVEAIRKLAYEFPKATKSSAEFRNGLRQLHKEFQIKERGEAAVKVLREFGRGLEAASSKTNLFAAAARSVVDHIKSFASYAMAASTVAGLVMGIREATTAIIDFDQALKDLQAITGASDREVEIMGDKIKEVAATTKFSAQEVADGMKTLGQAGLSASESIQTIDAVAYLATGTLTDMNVAVDLVTTAMRVFGIDASESMRVTDIFANAVNRSKLTVDKLRIALNYVGPVASRAGVSLEEVTSSMMLLANAGVRASTIGTGLRQVFRRLVDPSNELVKGLERIGLTVDDLNPKYNSMRDIIANLSIVVRDAEDAFQMFGMRGAAAVSALISESTNGFDKMYAAVNRAGAASEMAEKQMEGLGVKIKNMWDKAKNLAIVLGESGLTKIFHIVIDTIRTLLDLLIKFAETGVGKAVIAVTSLTTALIALAGVVKALRELAVVTAFIEGMAVAMTRLKTVVQGTTVAMGGLTAITAQGGVVSILSAVTTGFGNLVGVLSSFSSVVVAVASKVSGILVAAFNALRTVILALISVEGLLVAAIMGVVYGMYKLITHSSSVNKELTEQANNAKTAAENYGNLADSVTSMYTELAKLKEGTEEYKSSLIRMKGELLKVAEEEGNVQDSGLSKYALDAAESIDSLTGKLLDGGAALRTYRAEAQKLQAMKTAEATISLDERSSNNVNKYWTTLGREAAKVAIAFREGKMSYEEYASTILNWTGKLSDNQKDLKKDLLETRKAAADAIKELRMMGKIDMSMTIGQMLDVAQQEGYIKDSTSMVGYAMEELLGILKKADTEASGGFLEKWAKEVENTSDSFTLMQKIVATSSREVAESMDELDAKILQDFENQKRIFVARANAIKADNTLTVKEKAKAMSQLRDEVRKWYKQIQKEDDVRKATQIKKEVDHYRKQRKVIEAQLEGHLITKQQFAEKEIALQEKLKEKVQEIMADTYDPKIMKKKMDAWLAEQKMLMQSSLRSLALEQADSSNSSDGSFESRKIQLSLNYLRVVEQKYKEHYETLKRLRDEDDQDLIKSEQEYLDAREQRINKEIELVTSLANNRRDTEGRVTELLSKRKEETDKYNQEIVRIEDESNRKILSAKEQSEQRIRDLIRKREDVIQETEANILGIHESTNEKIRKIRQRDMTDEEKQINNLITATNKLARGRNLLSDALQTGDLSKLDKAKKLLEDAGGLFENLEDSSAAIEGLRKVEEALTQAAEASKKIKLDSIDEEIAKEKEKADKKIAEIKRVKKEAIRGEDERHAKEMKNLNDEIKKWESKLRVIRKAYDAARQAASMSVPQTRAMGGPVFKMAKGGRLPGADSKYDSVPVLARPGEWFIRNESVREWSKSVGGWFMNAVNNPMSSAGKMLMSAAQLVKTGIPTMQVPTLAGANGIDLQDFGTINFNLPVNGPEIPAMVHKDHAGELMRQLNEMKRFAS